MHKFVVDLFQQILSALLLGQQFDSRGWGKFTVYIRFVKIFSADIFVLWTTG